MYYPVENRHPILINADGKPTRHRYLRSDSDAPSVVASCKESATAHIFACYETGAERRYGWDGPPGDDA